MGILDRITGNNVVQMADYVAEPAAYNSDRAITAAAKEINLKSAGEILELQDRPYAEWQSEAWQYFDAIGEIKYGLGLLASIMSRVRIYPAVALDPDSAPTSTTQLRRREKDLNDEELEEEKEDRLTVPDDLTEEVMDYMDDLLTDLGSGYGGITGLMRSFTLNISVAGECYLINVGGRWSIRSTQECQYRDSDKAYVLKETRSGRLAGTVEEKTFKPGVDGTYAARIWRQHPRYSREPESTMISLLEPCDELLTIQRMIRGVARSRMNAGIVFIPDGITVAGSSVAETVEEAEEENDTFLSDFFDAITHPITDESASTSAVPLVLTGDPDLGEKIKHIQFNRESDRYLVERADKALERILNGIDVPKDMITGFASVKYNNAVKVDDDMYNSHIEPLAVMLADALTSVYVRQAVKKKFPDLNESTLHKLVFWYDPTEVVIKPNPAEAATQGYDRDLVNAAAWRRSNGYSDADAPTEAELAMKLVSKMNNVPPEVQSNIIRHALPSLFGEEDAQYATAPVDKAPPERRFGADDAITTDTVKPDQEE